MVHPFKGSYQAVKDLEDRIKETYPRHEDPDLGLTLEPSLEIICGDLVNDFLVKKDFKKTMRRIVYYIEGIDGLFQLPAKYKPTSQIIQQIKARASWAKDAVFLADLPEDEAFEVFKQKG